MIATKEITLTIDVKPCKGALGQTILQVAGDNRHQDSHALPLEESFAMGRLPSDVLLRLRK